MSTIDTTPGKEIIYFRESLLQSVLSDIFTFSILAGTVWFNQRFCKGSYFLNGVILVMFFLTMAAKANKKVRSFHSRKELLTYLNSNE